MDKMISFQETKNLKTSIWKETFKKKKCRYYFRHNKPEDNFIFLIVDPTHETIVHYIDRNVGLLYIPNNKQIVGVQIEGFEKSFMPHHNNVKKIWKLSGERRPNDLGEIIIEAERLKPMLAKEIIRSVHYEKSGEMEAAIS